MGDFDEIRNPYAVLGLEKGFESTDAEIRKVRYQSMSLPVLSVSHAKLTTVDFVKSCSWTYLPCQIRVIICPLL